MCLRCEVTHTHQTYTHTLYTLGPVQCVCACVCVFCFILCLCISQSLVAVLKLHTWGHVLHLWSNKQRLHCDLPLWLLYESDWGRRGGAPYPIWSPKHTLFPGSPQDTHTHTLTVGKHTCTCRGAGRCMHDCPGTHLTARVKTRIVSVSKDNSVSFQETKVTNTSHLARSSCHRNRSGSRSCRCSTCWHTLLRSDTLHCCRSSSLLDNLNINTFIFI